MSRKEINCFKSKNVTNGKMMGNFHFKNRLASFRRISFNNKMKNQQKTQLIQTHSGVGMGKAISL